MITDPNRIALCDDGTRIYIEDRASRLILLSVIYGSYDITSPSSIIKTVSRDEAWEIAVKVLKTIFK